MNIELERILNRDPKFKQIARRMVATVPLSVRLCKNYSDGSP